MTQQKKLKIIKILDDNTIISNKPNDIDIQINESFKIFSPNGMDITDPDTGEFLGTLSDEKGTVFVQEIHEKFIVYKSKFHPKEYTSPMLSTMKLAGLAGQVAKPAHYTSLNIDLDQVSGTISKSPIKIGDLLDKTY